MNNIKIKDNNKSVIDDLYILSLLMDEAQWKAIALDYLDGRDKMLKFYKKATVYWYNKANNNS